MGNSKLCPYCDGAGGFDDTDLECLDCDGTGYAPTCEPCDSKGWLRCDRCIGNYCERCERTDGMVRCHLCDGTGHSLEVSNG